MVLMMENDSDIEKGKIRVLNDEIRVLNDEIRVSSGLKSDIDEIRGLEGGYDVNGDNVEVDGGRILSPRGTVDGVVFEGGELESRIFELRENETEELEMPRISGTSDFRDGEKGGNLGSGDGGIVEGGKLESRNFEVGGNEVGELEMEVEMSRISGTNKFRDFEKEENDLGENVTLGSGRKGKSSLSREGGEGEGEGDEEIVVKGGELGENETGKLKMSRISGTEIGNDLGKNVALGSVRKGMSSLSSKGGEVDGGIVVRYGNLKSRKFESGENEIKKLEMSRISGTGKSREVEEGGNDVGRKVKSSLSSRADFLSGKRSKGKQKGTYKGEGSHMDGKDDNFKFQKRRDFGVSVGKKILGIDIDGSIMKSLKAKVLDTEFEMGDMVWGKVKSHPWWPGHLYNEAFASSSVRRTRGDGHILVAFFGDSSYGWFEPDELVPYDPHFTEKSQQTTSKNFVRALEESVDEASRRSALRLSCYCRNPNNFRPTNVPGYMAVDVSDVERDSIYSVSQIKKARDSFCPAEMLSFIRKLAITPMSSDSNKSLDFIQNNATTLTYRRSVYEEFDTTYAEAFGHKAVRRELPPVSELSRAPLSGPLVFADSRSGRKSSTKATKPKEQSKKDRYLLKRRDESGPSKKSKMSRLHSSPSSSPHEDGTSVSATSGYVLQKRDQAAVNNDLATSPAVDQLPTLGYAVPSEDSLTADRVLMSIPVQSETNEAATAETGDVRKVPEKSPSKAGDLVSSGSLLKKKKKAAKRPASELSFEKSEPKEKLVKKSRKSENSRSSSAMSDGVSPVNSLERPVQVAASIEDDTEVSNLKKDAEASNSDSLQVGLDLLAHDWVNEVDVRQTLANLRGIALYRLNGGETNLPATSRQFLLKFRSMAFLKGRSGSTVDDLDHGVDVADTAPTKKRKTTSSLKPLKIPSRKDSSIKGDRKRVLLERQEEKAAKRIKKITDVKSLTAEKWAVLSAKSEERGRKADRPVRVEEPTYLVMRFPSGVLLPSLVELKAKFTRFGPLDTSLSRVFFKTNTCRVAFLFKQDANVAYRYAVGSKTVFSNVIFTLRPVAGPESQVPNTAKTEDSNPGPSLGVSRSTTLAAPPQPALQLKSILKKPALRDESGGPSNSGGSSRTARVRFNIGEEKSGLPVPVQLKETRNPVFSSNKGAPLSPSSSNIAMDVNNNRRFMSELPLEPPLFPLPLFVRPPINTRRINFHESLAPSTTSLHSVSQVLLPPPPSVDISRDMVSLLTICDQMVNDVKNILGYMPYHEL